MTKSNFGEANHCGLTQRPESLSVAITDAICELIRDKTGYPLSCEQVSSSAETVDHGQLSLALAYTDLCLEEPEMVTSHHLKMLRRKFSYTQIQELSAFIKNLLLKSNH